MKRTNRVMLLLAGSVTVVVLSLYLFMPITGEQGPEAKSQPASKLTVLKPSLTTQAEERKLEAMSPLPDTQKDEKQGSGIIFSRPEERGEDFSTLDTTEVVKRVTESRDRTTLRKAAKVLGDRNIAGTLKISKDQARLLEGVVVGYLGQGKAKDSNEREEARQQIERLWRVAAPALLKNVGNKDPAIAELAIKSLILMRNETIVHSLIDIARSTNDEYTKVMAIFALKKMTEQRKSLIPGRACLDEKESKRLYDEVVVPTLNKLEAQSKGQSH